MRERGREGERERGREGERERGREGERINRCNVVGAAAHRGLPDSLSRPTYLCPCKFLIVAQKHRM